MNQHLDIRIFKLLRQQPYTADELSILTKSTKTELDMVMESLVRKGVEVKAKGSSYYIPNTHDVTSHTVLTGASPFPETSRFISTSDWHMGSIQHDVKGLESCIHQALDMGAQFILHSGDLTDGYGVYPGQLNNLLTWKADDQAQIAIDFVKRLPIPVYGIGGNHDYSFTQQNGVRPPNIVAHGTKNYKDLGDFQADVVLGGVEIRLLHGAGGNAYAQSYPAQKYLRNLAEGTPEQVPDMLLLGHYHTNPMFEIYGCLVMHPSNFQGPNDFMIRRGLRGVRGLYVVEVTTQNGRLMNYNPVFLKANTN